MSERYGQEPAGEGTRTAPRPTGPSRGEPSLAGPLAAASAEAAGAIPAALGIDTLRAALGTATSRVAVTGAMVAALVEGEIAAMGLLKLKAASLVFLIGLSPPGDGVCSSRRTQGGEAERHRTPARTCRRTQPTISQPTRHRANWRNSSSRLLASAGWNVSARQLFLMDLETGKVGPIVDEPGKGHAYCGSPCWSSDGQQILFDATPMVDWHLSRLMAIRWATPPQK